MLIDTKQIITMTELRERLTEILILVEKGKEMMISDRGKIKAKISPIKKRTVEEGDVDEFMAEVEKLGKSLSAKNRNFNSLKALREVRRKS